MPYTVQTRPRWCRAQHLVASSTRGKREAVYRVMRQQTGTPPQVFATVGLWGVPSKSSVVKIDNEIISIRKILGES